MPPQHVILEPFLEENLPLNSRVTYKCRQGFQPRHQITAVCMNDTMWSPSPTDHVCTGDCSSNNIIIELVLITILLSLQMRMNAN